MHHAPLPWNKGRRKDPGVPAIYHGQVTQDPHLHLGHPRKALPVGSHLGLSHMLETLDGRQKLALNPELPGAWLLSQRPSRSPAFKAQTDRQRAGQGEGSLRVKCRGSEGAGPGQGQ